MTVLTFTRETASDAPESLPDAPTAKGTVRAAAAAALPPPAAAAEAGAADAWSAEDAAFMAEWDDGSRSGDDADDALEVDPATRLLDGVADAVLDGGDDALRAVFVRLATSGAKAEHYRRLVEELAWTTDDRDDRAALDASGLTGMLDDDDVAILGAAVRAEVARRSCACTDDDLLDGLDPAVVAAMADPDVGWGDDDDGREIDDADASDGGGAPARPRTVHIPALGVNVSLDPDDDDDDDDDRDLVFSRDPSGLVVVNDDDDGEGGPARTDGDGSVRRPPHEPRSDVAGPEYLEKLARDLGKIVVNDGVPLHSF